MGFRGIEGVACRKKRHVRNGRGRTRHIVYLVWPFMLATRVSDFRSQMSTVRVYLRPGDRTTTTAYPAAHQQFHVSVGHSVGHLSPLTRNQKPAKIHPRTRSRAYWQERREEKYGGAPHQRATYSPHTTLVPSGVNVKQSVLAAGREVCSVRFQQSHSLMVPSHEALPTNLFSTCAHANANIVCEVNA